ncbi:MAG: non-homologous end-joining DNA ligase [Spirochaetia bacterium]|nr:non-homologous end-joining DNA ligase [Spirochaetia bacterium]
MAGIVFLGAVASKKTTVLAGKRRLELSNLDKVLFANPGIVKAQIIEYYLRVAPAMLRHLKGRPLSLVRYPEGIGGETFFQKNRPDWAPDWMEYVRIEKIDYMLAQEEAALAFLANLASIEFHQMQIRPQSSPDPDYIVFDLDPPEDYQFTDVIKIAFNLREYLESQGYHTFAKTTGNKGIHILIPIQPQTPYDAIFAEAKRLADKFIEQNPETTLHIKKESRKGRVLVDIYRNRPGQTIVCAYSLRGKDGAAVSMPVTWDELETLTSPGVYNLLTVPGILDQRGDVWEAMYAYSTPLGGKAKQRSIARVPKNTRLTPDPNDLNAPDESDVPDGTLTAYRNKRSFEKTPEPPPEFMPGHGNVYVIHRHHASRLHYDLRLEENGTLKSWAVPKGLPPIPGIKRMAVQVEEHPLKYADFEGVIPKGQYGAGKMWIFSRGKYEITKRKKEGFYLKLNSEELTAEYRMIHTRENEWLMERVDPQTFPGSVEPMLAVAADKPPSGDYSYEVKWDGIRAIFFLLEGQLRIQSRSGRDITQHFPELQTPEALRATDAVLDGEIVCLDGTGKPIFTDVIRRIQQSGTGIERMAKKHPAVCYLFDCLYLDGRSIMKDPLRRRRDWLEDIIKGQTSFRFSESHEDGDALFEAAANAGLEGIMARDLNSPYIPAKRSQHWIKVKSRKTAECIIIGFTAGQSARKDTFGALLLASKEEKGLRYSGSVGGGFDDRELLSIRKQLEKLATKAGPVVKVPTEMARDVTWIEPTEWCEIEYASITRDGMFREPVFLRLRPDRADTVQ